MIRVVQSTILILALSVRSIACPQSFAEYRTQFATTVAATFGHEASVPFTKKAIFVTKAFSADLSEKVFNNSGIVISVRVNNQLISLNPDPLVLNTANNDCSVNHICDDCSGKHFLARAECEAERASCAVVKSPIIAGCAALKALNGTKLASIDVSGGQLSVTGEADALSLTLDPSLSSAILRSSVLVGAMLSHAQAHVSVFPLVGIMAGCPFPPTVNIPPIALAVTNPNLPIPASVETKPEPAENPKSVNVILKTGQIQIDADFDPSSIFSWIASNPLALLGCPLPSLAAFIAITTVEHRQISVPSSDLTLPLSSVSLTRDGHSLEMEPKINDIAIGLVEK